MNPERKKHKDRRPPRRRAVRMAASLTGIALAVVKLIRELFDH